MEYRFYKVTGGKLSIEMNRIRDEKDAFKKLIDSIVSDVGAEDWLQYQSGGVAAFTFKSQPDMKHWKKEKYGYMPRLGNKKGKELSKLMHSIPTPTDYDKALEIYALHNMMVFGEATGRGVRTHDAYVCGSFDSDIFFIKVPQEKDGGYEPRSNELVEVKEWEMVKFMDELGEK